MSITKPTLLCPNWANTPADPSDVLAPSAGVQDAGLGASAAALPYEWFNWLFHVVGGTARYLLGRGIPDWDYREEYTVGDIVQLYATNVVYRCLQTCTNVIPGTDPSAWELFGVHNNWLADALKTRLASTLPPLMSSALQTLFQVALTGNATSGSITFFGFQICWHYLAFQRSGDYPVMSSFTWNKEFGSIYSVSATSNSDNINCGVPLGTLTTTTCMVVPRSITTAFDPTDAVFVIGFGTVAPA